jgi:hypothetical protein
MVISSMMDEQIQRCEGLDGLYTEIQGFFKTFVHISL